MSKNQNNLYPLLGGGILFLSVVLFIFVISLMLQIGQQEGIDLDESALESRYLSSAIPSLPSVDDAVLDDSQNISKQGVLQLEETRKILSVEKELTQSEIEQLEEKYDIEFTSDIPKNGIYVVTISDETEIQDLETELDASLETDIPVKIAADTIDWGISRIGADKVWTNGSGSGVVVAVVDTGVQLNHPDLANNIVSGYDFVNNNEVANDDNGHGTHVAGIVAATLNQAGTVGASHSAKIMPVKVLNNQGYGYLSDVAKGVYFAADNGARVINLSLGGTSDSLTLKNAVNYAYNKGVLLVGAAGNEGGNPCIYPAAYSSVICVVATDSKNMLASFSNIGGELAAPGVSNYSTFLNSTYRYLSGTSMASPHVAGAGALLMSVCPTCTTSEIRNLLRESAVDLGEVGNDILFGYGLVDLTSAVSVLQPVEQEPDPVEETPPVEEEPTTEQPTTKKPTKKENPRQNIKIEQPIPTRGQKYIPTEVGDIDVVYSLDPVATDTALSRVTLYVDNSEITTSKAQTGTFVVSKDLLNHSQHWVKVTALFSDGSSSSAQMIIDMTYLKSLQRSNQSSQRSVLGVSTSIFGWLRYLLP